MALTFSTLQEANEQIANDADQGYQSKALRTPSGYRVIRIGAIDITNKATEREYYQARVKSLHNEEISKPVVQTYGGKENPLSEKIAKDIESRKEMKVRGAQRNIENLKVRGQKVVNELYTRYGNTNGDINQLRKNMDTQYSIAQSIYNDKSKSLIEQTHANAKMLLINNDIRKLNSIEKSAVKSQSVVDTIGKGGSLPVGERVAITAGNTALQATEQGIKATKIAVKEYKPTQQLSSKVMLQKQVDDNLPSAPAGATTAFGQHGPRTYRITNNLQGHPEIAQEVRGSSTIGVGRPGIMAKSIASPDDVEPVKKGLSRRYISQHKSVSFAHDAVPEDETIDSNTQQINFVKGLG
jgi:ribosomal protein S13